MKRALVMMALAATLAGGSIAAQAEETDVASIKCSEFLQNKDAIPMFVMWIDGYMSQKSENTVISDEWIQKLSQHMGTYCSQNPDATILDAASALK